MRIIYDFTGKDPVASGTGRPYLFGNIFEPPQYRGFQAEVLLVDGDQARDGQPFREGDAVYLEGNGDTLLNVLKQAIRLLEFSRDHAKKIAEEQIARTVQCEKCHTYYDTKGEWHADGKGNRCSASRAA